MPGERSGFGLDDEEIAERAIVLQVLRDDHDERWSRAELEREIYDIEPLALGDALERLRQEGVVHLSGEQVWASRCALRLDALGMVSI
jgi:DNA-binding HxlR family transcriptional regulator